MAGANEIAALVVTLGADTAQFASGMAKATKDADSFKGKLAAAMRVGAAAVAAGAVAAAGSFAMMAQSAMAAADDIGDAAARLGIAASSYQKLQAAAVAAGGTPEIMTAALDKLNVGLGTFIQTGGGPAASAFEQLGIASKITSGEIKTADEAFYAAATALENVTSPAEKARLSMQLFGRAAGTDMLEVLAAGGAGLRGFGEQAQAAGRVMSEDMIGRLADAKLELDKTKFAFSQFTTVLAGQGIVAVMDFAEGLRPMIEQGKQLAKQVGEFLGPSFKELASAVGALMSGPFGQALVEALKTVGMVIGGTLVGAIRLAVDAVTLLVKAFDFLVRPIAELGIRFHQAGRDIIAGFVRGIEGGIGQAVAAVRRLVNRVKEFFTGPDGIDSNSPSRVFMEYGRFIVDGLERGIRGRSDAAVEAMRSLADEIKGIWQDLLSEQERAELDLVARQRAINAGVRAGLLTRAEADQLLDRLYQRELERFANDNPTPEVQVDTGRGGITASNPRIDMSPLDRAEEAQKQADEYWKAVEDEEANFRDFWRRTVNDGFRAAMNGDLGGFFKNWMQTAAQDALTDALNTLADAFSDWLSGVLKGNGGFGSQGGSDGGMSGLFRAGLDWFKSKLPGFRTGGNFRVGGSGGPDSKLVAFRATPGEMVDIRRPGNDNGGPGVVNVYAEGYVAQETLRQMIAEAMIATGRGTHAATINTLQTRANRSLARA